MIPEFLKAGIQVFPLSSIPEFRRQLTPIVALGQAGIDSRSMMTGTPRRFSGLPFIRGYGMAAESTEARSGKARKRLAAKAGVRQAAGKVKATIHLSVEASQRLTIHAAMLGMDRSELVESLIYQHLRRFVVSDRGGVESGNSGRAESLNS
jgi:hypothetical protein